MRRSIRRRNVAQLLGLPPLDPDFSSLKLAIEHGRRVARMRLNEHRPEEGEPAWKGGIACTVSMAVVNYWLELCMERAYFSFKAEDDFLVLLPNGEQIVIEVKGSFAGGAPPWPVSKGMGGWQRERRRKQLTEGVKVMLVQVAVKNDASVSAAVVPLSFDNVPPGKHTADYKRKFEQAKKYGDPLRYVLP